MSETTGDTVEAIFPRIGDIEDATLRQGVIDAWAYTHDNTDTPLEQVPWSPEIQARLDLPDELLVDHINDVTEVSYEIATCINQLRDIELSVDIVVAGALVHDISKPFESENKDLISIDSMLGHPYYGIYLATNFDLPLEVVHIVLSHTHRTSVEPATIEAEIVSRADSLAADAIRQQAVELLKFAR